MRSVPTVAENASPSRTRHWLLVFAATLAIITYVDRVCMSQAKVAITADLGLSSVQIGYIFAAFTSAYALFEVPAGWLGDRLGPRRVLMRIVLLWSLFTAATGGVWNFISLLLVQFGFGAAEAGAFPNLAKAFTNWLPTGERNRAVGIMWLCARWGGAVTPLLVVWVIGLVGWRWAFVAFATPGLLWALWFFVWFRDNPRDHPAVNAAELKLLPSTTDESVHVASPWSKLLRSRTVWLLFIQYFCFGYGWYFYITWLPTYVREARGLELQKGALLAGLPLFFGGIACMVSGWLASWLVRRGFRLVYVRRGIAFCGFGGAAGLLLLSPQITDPVWAMIAMGLASFSLDLALPVCWRSAMDAGGRYAGTVTGTMNMAGQLGGAVGPIVVGYVLQYMNHNWTLTFVIAAGIYLVGAVCWLWIDPVTPLDRAEAADSTR